MAMKVEICGINTATLPKLTHKETMELIEKSKIGDEVAKEKLIIANMRLVLSVVQRFGSKRGCADDVFQVGCVGLIKAIDNFNTSLNVRFSTYAVPMIIGEIRRYLRDGNSFRVSRSLRDTAYQALKTRERLEAETGDETTMEQISNELNLPLKDVVYALDAISDPVSLYDPVYHDSGDTILLMDQIGDTKNTDENWIENVAIENAMNVLSNRERQIISLRYFEGKTQMEVSEEIAISQAQVSRLEKTALSSIKKNLSC